MAFGFVAVVVVLGLQQGRASAQTTPSTLPSPTTSTPATVPSSTPTTIAGPSGGTGSTFPIVDDCTCDGPGRVPRERDRHGRLLDAPVVDQLIEDIQADFAAIADRIFTKPPTEPATSTARPPVDTTTSTSRPPVDLCTAPPATLAPPTTRPPVIALAAGGAGGTVGGAQGMLITCPPVTDDGGDARDTAPVVAAPMPTLGPIAPTAPELPIVVVVVPPVDPVVLAPVDEPPPDDPQPPQAQPPPVPFVTVALPPLPLSILPVDPLPEVAFVDLVVPPPPVPGPPVVVPPPDGRPAPVPLLRPLVVRGVGPGRPSALPGGLAEATGVDCPAGSPVTLRVEGRDVGRTTASAVGMFQLELSLPFDLQTGRRLVSASCGPVTLEGRLQIVQTSSNRGPGAGITTLAALLSLFLLIVLLLRTPQDDRRPVQ
jgi:hypothetical protein